MSATRIFQDFQEKHTIENVLKIRVNRQTKWKTTVANRGSRTKIFEIYTEGKQ